MNKRVHLLIGLVLFVIAGVSYFTISSFITNENTVTTGGDTWRLSATQGPSLSNQFTAKPGEHIYFGLPSPLTLEIFDQVTFTDFDAFRSLIIVENDQVKRLKIHSINRSREDAAAEMKRLLAQTPEPHPEVNHAIDEWLQNPNALTAGRFNNNVEFLDEGVGMSITIIKSGITDETKCHILLDLVWIQPSMLPEWRERIIYRRQKQAYQDGLIPNEEFRAYIEENRHLLPFIAGPVDPSETE